MIFFPSRVFSLKIESFWVLEIESSNKLLKLLFQQKWLIKILMIHLWFFIIIICYQWQTVMINCVKDSSLVKNKCFFLYIFFFFPFLFVFFNLYVHNIGIGTSYISCLRMILQLLFLLMAKTFQRIRFQTVISIIIVESTFIYSIVPIS